MNEYQKSKTSNNIKDLIVNNNYFNNSVSQQSSKVILELETLLCFSISIYPNRLFGDCKCMKKFNRIIRFYFIEIIPINVFSLSIYRMTFLRKKKFLLLHETREIIHQHQTPLEYLL